MRRREFITLLGGGAAAWPIAAGAQQRAMPVIGYLSATTEAGAQPFTAAFLRGLDEQGYIDGRDVDILYRFAELRFDRLPELATELVSRRVAVLATTGDDAAALSAKSVTATNPIVFTLGGDPVERGLVASLNRPGGNITGITILTQNLTAKRLELLHEIVPAVTSVGFLVNPTSPSTEPQIREAEAAARILGLRLTVLKAGGPSEIEAAFATLVEQRIGALLPAGDPLYGDRRDQLAALAARHGVPAIYTIRENVEAGGLMSYGASLSDAWRLAGTYVGRILKGEKPSDLPVQQSTRIEMVLNLKTAKALGIEVPTATLLRANEVIE